MAMDARVYFIDNQKNEVEEYLNKNNKFDLLVQFTDLVKNNKNNLDRLSEAIKQFKENNKIPEVIPQKTPSFFERFGRYFRKGGRKSRKSKKTRKYKKSRKSKKRR